MFQVGQLQRNLHFTCGYDAMIVPRMEILIQPLPRTDRHRLAGTVTVDGVPASRLVVVQDRTTFNLVAASLSAYSSERFAG